ncbi:PHP domain-containing protein [Fusibacter paucivorans]|uniref:PHP domain-containing protein n=1 Tax=Fusibacter paucivorans TaxID=76009 RepID=A0ABS5PP44_9FIRM|nr:PHP domain-containing protein [Fusibacter paucivorans]MBS7526950.1 PHP domain-containing protein [Fusibacter paucivorans]
MKIDFHVHSAISLDSYMQFETILERVDLRGLDGVVIVDHNNMSEAETLNEVIETHYRNIDPKSRPLIIRGAEYSTECGHLIVLGLRTPLEAILMCEDRRYQCTAVIEAARLQDAFIILAHPYRIKGKQPSEELLQAVDAIEVYNARSAYLRNNFQANALAVQAAKKYGKPIVAGSDAHLPMEVGNAYLEIDCPRDVFSLEQFAAYQTQAFGFPTHPMYECISQGYKAICQKNPVALLKNAVKLLYSLFLALNPSGRALEGLIMTYYGETVEALRDQ